MAPRLFMHSVLWYLLSPTLQLFLYAWKYQDAGKLIAIKQRQNYCLFTIVTTMLKIHLIATTIE